MTYLKYLTLIPLVFVVGCVSAPSQMPFIDKTTGETEVGEEARAYVGDTIYRKFDIKKQYEGYVNGSFGATGGTINLADTKVQRMLVDGKDGALVRDPVTATSMFGIPSPVYGLLFIDEDSDGMFDKYNIPMAGTKKLKTPIVVDWQESNRSSGYSRELIYQGRDGNNLKFFYREFNDDFRRPAYDQEVQYDLDESDYAQFKGLTIRIVEANNEYLTFEIEGGSLWI